MTDITLTLSQTTLASAKLTSFRRGISLSELVDKLLVAELTAPASICDHLPRRIDLIQEQATA